MDKSRNNILRLAFPNRLVCSVSSYQPKFGVLKIELQADTDYLPIGMITFTSILYYSGLFAWHGARFRYGTDEERLAIFSRIDPSITSSTQLDRFATLYIAQGKPMGSDAGRTTDFEIHILASKHFERTIIEKSYWKRWAKQSYEQE